MVVIKGGFFHATIAAVGCGYCCGGGVMPGPWQYSCFFFCFAFVETPVAVVSGPAPDKLLLVVETAMVVVWDPAPGN